MRLFIFFILCTYYITSPAQTDTLHLNQIQILASHNSYKKTPDERVMKFLMKQKKRLGDGLNPEGIDYGHLTFDEQFDNYGIRGLEIDIYNDPQGGVFYKRRINGFIKGKSKNSDVNELKQPGFKVLHIKDVDYETNYYTFKDALRAVKQWSDAHPKHLPLFINIETKGDSPGDESRLLHFVGFRRCIKFDASACDSIDSEIKSVFGSDLKGILTPDRIRGSFPTLDAMATDNGWPQLSNCRGKIIFIMEGQAVKSYLSNHPSLQGRAMFVYAQPGTPECAFVVRNEPEKEDKINELVAKGYIVRTRADSETREARSNDYTRMKNAFDSGAQIISTDYYKPDTRFSTYQVKFPNGQFARKNPLNVHTADAQTGLKE